MKRSSATSKRPLECVTLVKDAYATDIGNGSAQHRCRVVQKKEQGVSLSQSPGWPIQALTEREVPPGEASALLANLRRAAYTEIVQTGEPEPPRTPLSLAEAYRSCYAITRKHSRSFFLSSQL